MRFSRRALLLGGTTTLVTATFARPSFAADARKRFPACGCVDPYPDHEFSDCLTHDDKGRRWDSYAGREVAELHGYSVFSVADGEEEYCDNCGFSEPMAAGTLFAAWMSGYYEPEPEQKCLDCLRDDWLFVQTTDWYAWQREEDAHA